MIKKIALAGSVAAVGLATPAFADVYTAPTVNGTATVRLYTAIDLQKVSDIDFGTVIRRLATTSGSVYMDAAGVVDCTAVTDVTCTGSPSEGHFTVQGDAGSDMSISLDGTTFDPSTNIMQLVNGTDSVNLALQYAGMTQDVNPLTSATLGTFSVTGTGSAQDLRLHGTLSFGDATVAPNGVYVASFNLTADYK